MECYKGWTVHMERFMLCISWAYKLAGSVVRLAISAPPPPPPPWENRLMGNILAQPAVIIEDS